MHLTEGDHGPNSSSQKVLTVPKLSMTWGGGASKLNTVGDGAKGQYSYLAGQANPLPSSSPRLSHAHTSCSVPLVLTPLTLFPFTHACLILFPTSR